MRVLWTDESKFEVFGSKRRTFVHRFVGQKILAEFIVPTVNHGGGSVMVLGCFSIVGVGELIRVENRMRKEDYMQILEQYAIPPGCHLISRNFIMHQNKDLKHSSKLRKGFLLLKETQGVLDNMKSLDLNPIELLWEEIDRNIRFHCLTSKEHLWQILQEV